MYLYLKALHIIFVVCWFAGLFYIVRLFVYYAEAQLKTAIEKEILSTQYQLMTNRLWYIITFPAAVLATLFGFLMLIENPAFAAIALDARKTTFLLYYFGYIILSVSNLLSKLKTETLLNQLFFRIWNEGATIILFSVVFLVILKSAITWIFGVIGIFVLALLLTLGFKMYKKIRDKN